MTKLIEIHALLNHSVRQESESLKLEPASRVIKKPFVDFCFQFFKSQFVVLSTLFSFCLFSWIFDEMCYKVNWEGKNDGRVLLCRYGVECLKVAKLKRRGGLGYGI